MSVLLLGAVVFANFVFWTEVLAREGASFRAISPYWLAVPLVCWLIASAMGML